MKLILSILMVMAMAMSLPLPLYSQVQTIYVSPKGDDRSVGDEKHPLKSINSAISKASQLPDSIRIVLKSGEHRTLNSIVVRQGAWSSLEIVGEDGAKVSGDIVVKSSMIKSVKDKDIVSRLQPDVRGQVRVIDFAKAGINLHDIHSVGFGRPSDIAWSELVVDDKQLKMSRWPNDEMALIGKVLVSGDKKDKIEGRLPVFKFSEKQPLTWKNDGNMWIAGYFGHGYADDMIKIKEINHADTTMHPNDFTIYQFFSGADFRRWYALNVIEEIDLEGEYVLDAKNGKLYFYPPVKRMDKIRLTTLDEPIFSIEGCRNVTIKSLIIENSRGIGVYMERSENVVVDDCILRNLGSVGVSIGKGTYTPNKRAVNPHSMESGGELRSRMLGDIMGSLYENASLNRLAGSRCGVRNSYIYNTGSGGVSLGGGDRKTLTRADNFVENCIITNYNRIEKSYRPGVWIDGVGCRVSKCDIFDAPSMAILFHGNDHVIEYCNISNVCKDVDDQGAVYYGRDPSERGHKIRYNYFKDLSPRHRVTATYHDDGACGSEVYGNIYYRAGSLPVLIGGGMDHNYYGNIFIESPAAIHVDNRLTHWGRGMVAPNGIFDVRLRDIKHDKAPYSEAYPELVNYWNESPADPKRNTFHGNLFFKIGTLVHGQESFGEFWNNWETDENPGFVDVNDPLKGFTHDAAVFNHIEGFKEIDYKNIGSTLDKAKVLK